jgi:hypothetical protein
MMDDRKPLPKTHLAETHLADGDLDALFAQARRADPAPLPDPFLARLTAQAEAMVPAPPVAAPVRRGWLAGLRDILSDIGGAPGLAGLSVAGVAGVWIGFVQPEAIAGAPGLLWEGASGVSPTVAGLLDASTPFDDFDPLP